MGYLRSSIRWLEGTAGVKRFQTFRIRLIVQAGFAATCILLGFQFSRFLSTVRARGAPLPVRPPGVEGFLPISGLMGALDWIYQGTINRIHPAATVLFLVFLAISILLRKGFCSWICPAGFMSESLARLGQKIFGRNFRPPQWLDVPLRGLKYLLLGFFLWAIFGMSPPALRAFIDSPYNRVSDVKMYLFFADIGPLALKVLVVLAVASIFVQGAWCRFLCPYGALLGLFSWMSPVKIRRGAETCTSCGLCDEVCMARLPISKKARIVSAECTGCLDCVAACPVSATLTAGSRTRRVGPFAFAMALLLLFFTGYTAARGLGLWRNDISDAEYIQRVHDMDGADYGHPGM
ncbi:MAG: 4Fe-4S binding protein [Candidatus Eisenbacteria bacterium]